MITWAPRVGDDPADALEGAEGPGVDSALLLLLLSEALPPGMPAASPPKRFAASAGESLADLAPGSLLAALAPSLTAYGRDAWVVAGGHTQVLELTLTGLRFVLAERVATAAHPAGCIDVFIHDAPRPRLQFRYCRARGVAATEAGSTQ